MAEMNTGEDVVKFVLYRDLEPHNTVLEFFQVRIESSFKHERRHFRERSRG
jgi:hypothetical protein